MRRHPLLSKKLGLLYRLRVNPQIASHASLARAIGVSRQAVGKWVKGTDTRLGDAIPFSQLDQVASIFDIPALWFTLEYHDFEQRVSEKAEKLSRIAPARPAKVFLSLLPATSAHIQGREEELELLDSAWSDDGVNLAQIVAWGGVGKTSLVNTWLSGMEVDGFAGARQVYAWSFYWQGNSSDIRASGDYFIEQALSWFGDRNPAEGSPWSKALRLANLINRTKTLLILDGLEPMQLARGPHSGQIDHPAVALLIKELAVANKGLCIITSRIEVTGLDNYYDGRVLLKRLDSLPVDAGVEMLHSLGVRGSRGDLIKAVNHYQGHPLSLALLAGYLKIIYEGRIEERRNIKSLFEDEILGARAKEVMLAYVTWFKDTDECSLLFLVGLFDRGIAIRELRMALSSYPDVEGLTRSLSALTEAQLRLKINTLQQSNLVTIRKMEGTEEIDCHPMIRDFLGAYLSGEFPVVYKKGHELIFRYLQSTAVSDPKSMADLEPLFRAVIHGTQAGFFQEAFDVYFERIKMRYTMLSVGSHYTDQECIRSFFEKPWYLPISNLNDVSKYRLLSSAATNLMALGRLDESIKIGFATIRWFVAQEQWLQATNLAGPYVSMLIASGRLREALELLDELKLCVENTQNPVIQAMADSFYGHAIHLAGQDDIAEDYFLRAEAILNSEDPAAEVAFPTVSSYYCKFLLDTGRIRESLERSQLTLAWRNRKSWQVAIDTTSLLASDLQLLGLAFAGSGDLVNAKRYLEQQVKLLRDADEWLYLPSALTARGRYHCKAGNMQDARHDFEESLNIARNSGAVFGEWEAGLCLARLYCEQKDLGAAAECLQSALELPGMDDYKFMASEINALRALIGQGGRDEIASDRAKQDFAASRII